MPFWTFPLKFTEFLVVCAGMDDDGQHVVRYRMGLNGVRVSNLSI